MKKLLLLIILSFPMFAQSYIGASYSAGDGTRGGVILGMFVIGDWAIETHYWEPPENTINYGLSLKHFDDNRMKYIVFDFANKIPKFRNDPNIHHLRGLQFGVGRNVFKTAKFSFPIEAGVGSLYDWEDKNWETVFYANIGVIY